MVLAAIGWFLACVREVLLEEETLFIHALETFRKLIMVIEVGLVLMVEPGVRLEDNLALVVRGIVRVNHKVN